MNTIFYIVLVLVIVFSIMIRIFMLKKDSSLPYHSKGSLLTKSELHFYKQIQPLLFQYEISVSFKPRVWDLIDVDKGTDKSYSWQNKISSKHVDFALIDSDTKILGVIELDDPSHNRKDRIESDNFKNNAFRSARIPVIRVKTAKRYDVDAIALQLSNLKK